MGFRISGLSPEPFRHLYGLSNEELEREGVKRYVADKRPGFPDRIEMRDADIGQRLLLLNHVCQPADTPYRATHAIFIREGAEETYDRIDEVPEVMRIRLLSLRAYDSSDMMVDADVVDGREIETIIGRLFGNAQVAYIHAHNAKRGCYSGRIERV
jgi:DNA-binding Lrp family transcriptional regulator